MAAGPPGEPLDPSTTIGGEPRTRGDAVNVRELLETHRRPVGDLDAVARCVDACRDCVVSCTVCADADLADPDIGEMLRCIRLCLDCADTCDATGRVAARQTERDGATLGPLLEA